MTVITAQPQAAPAVPASRSRQAAAPIVAFLGAGRMGSPMAANLARAGFGVRVWNRTSGRAEALAADGAVVVTSPAQAVRGASIVITMLADGPATSQAASGPDGLLAGPPGLTWVQMATIGNDWTGRLATAAAARGAVFVDAPVSGSEGPAQAGQLVILASGPDGVHDELAPVFAALGRATVWLGAAGNGSRAKLVLNNWLADLTESAAESLAFAGRLGLDQSAMIDLIAQTPLGSPYAIQKARAMLAADFRPAFALKHALKDAELAAQAARLAGTELALTEALLPRWRQAVAAGYAEDDLAAIYATS